VVPDREAAVAVHRRRSQALGVVDVEVNNEDVVVGLPEHDGWRNAVASLDEDEGAYYST
jgi:hypothetical protein